MNKVIDVRFKAVQGAEDLYVSVSDPYRVYVRQPFNVGDRVFWCTSSKWQGGYEASAPLREGITMRVVDKKGSPLFEESLVKDEWNGGTSAVKRGPFSYEAIKELAANFEKDRGLKSHESWRDFVLQDKEAFNNKDYSDTWVYYHVERLDEKILGFSEVLGQKYCFVEEKNKHKISGKEWTSYFLMDEKNETILAVCGYSFDDVREKAVEKYKKGDQVTIRFSSLDWPHGYADCTYSHSRAGKHYFESDTYGWMYIVDAAAGTVVNSEHPEKVYSIDNSTGWANGLVPQRVQRDSLDKVIDAAKEQQGATAKETRNPVEELDL